MHCNQELPFLTVCEGIEPAYPNLCEVGTGLEFLSLFNMKPRLRALRVTSRVPERFALAGASTLSAPNICETRPELIACQCEFVRCKFVPNPSLNA